ncbi:MAG: FAD-dependent oxidoreductase [Thermoprotei archaeon]|nr:MAG: FAD-dependent oxidoreductase [Thermoprotei archaeon]
MKFDIAIIGAGPAGLFAAYELATRARSKVRVVLVDKGPRASERSCPLITEGKCIFCKPCRVLHGVGGAGALSSFLINLRPDIGGDLHELLGDWDEADNLIKYVDSIVIKFGAPPNSLHIPDEKIAKELEKKAIRAGATFIPSIQRYIGTDYAVKIVESMTNYIENKGIKLLTKTEVRDINKVSELFKLCTSIGEIEAKYLLLAPGRSGAEWYRDIARKLDIKTVPGPLDVGIRVEVPAIVMDEITDIVRDPKIIMHTKRFDDKVRTFCTNPRGFVVKEVYDDGTVGVNGESYRRKKSSNTNFALLVTIRLTDPMEDTIEYGKSIVRLATKLGGGKPLIQRFGDLESGRRSTWDRVLKSSISPTLKDVTPGDISMALPYRVVANLVEALRRLNRIIPGVASSQTLLYAPEIKFYSVKTATSRDMETNVENIFVAGDGTGLSRGINVAAATGILAARGILKKLGLYD